MDKRVFSVDPIHQRWVLQEPCLYGLLDENAKTSLKPDDLKSMSPGNVNCSRLKVNGKNSSAHLIDRIDQGPVENLNDIGELAEDPARKSVVERVSVRRRYGNSEAEEIDVSRAP